MLPESLISCSAIRLPSALVVRRVVLLATMHAFQGGRAARRATARPHSSNGVVWFDGWIGTSEISVVAVEVVEQLVAVQLASLASAHQ